MSNHSLIVHGHFYQPTREDPFTGTIPPEAGAYPFQNWNERIYAECYLANVNLGNFEKISFNLGPTLFEWIEKYHQDTNSKIIQQDKAIMTGTYRVFHPPELLWSINFSIIH